LQFFDDSLKFGSLVGDSLRDVIVDSGYELNSLFFKQREGLANFFCLRIVF